ncbi:MAG: TatD family hydrolase [candidate division Zixibacteria bacterium]|nr:TatD family hydrolase [candidate division Zixibacteria bacterium]NIR64502.1 TatD family hydrolase [candidate division Zixibacteria bacterium]NIS16554.1 TatD family hydrolase [candidate division Zixibacteria bacterium]NIS46402.1 TatD family hydrolase [candidate division Zixibacteria bacterium]NIT52929.1 TatD family hydrolase [candidate division Zixibacteria bacterium]
MIDTHCHLDFENYDDDREEVIKATIEGGVYRMINIGIDEETSIKGLELSEKYENIYASIGYHPHSASEFNRQIQDKLERLAQHPKAVAIGEIGLDYYRNYSPREDQINAFRRQIRLAADLELPIVVHIREAMEESLKILKEEKAGEFGGVLHCFPGSYEDSQRALEMNLMVAFGGTLTFNNSRAAKVAERVPLKQIILETDAPFLTPVPFRGKRNSPLYVHYVYKKLAEIKQIDFAELEKKIDKTAVSLFNLT